MDSGNYLRDWRRRTAENVLAHVVARRPDGDYTCTLLDTGGTVWASRGSVSVELVKGQTVTLSRPESSGRSRNTGYVIIAFAPSSSKGSSDSTAINNTTSKGGVTVAIVSPHRTHLTGVAQTITVYGTGFTASTAISYGSASVIDAATPVITSTQITLSIVESSPYAAGLYSLSVGGVVIPEVFEVASFVGVRAYQTVDQTGIVTSTTTPITFDAESYDNGGFHSTSANTDQFVVPAGQGGLYLVTACLGLQNTSGGEMGLTLNGAVVAITKELTGGAGNQYFNIAAQLLLAAGDVVRLYGWHSSGANRSTNNPYTWFAMVRIGSN